MSFKLAFFFASSPAIWELWSWSIVSGGALFECLSEKLNYWAKSRALELTHTKGKKWRLELLLPIAIYKFVVVLYNWK